MKTTVTKGASNRTYPYLATPDENINGVEKHVVMFTAPKTGVVVHSDISVRRVGDTSVRRVGDTRVDWYEESFTPYTGTVTLSND